MNDTIPKKIEFDKKSDSGVLSCTVEVCEDKSVYVIGDELEMMFEFAPDNLANAIEHVEGLGYQRRQS